MNTILKTTLAAIGLLACVLATAGEQIAYVSRAPAGDPKAYLVTSLGDLRVQVVNRDGFAVGSTSSEGPGVRRVTFDGPLTYQAPALDACGSEAQVRREVQQVIFRRLDGTVAQGRSSVTELGVQTFLDGCEPGKVEAFGSEEEAGEPLVHQAMSLRPSMDDLKPGVRLAGAVESAYAGYPGEVPRDIVEILPGSRLKFETTGTVVPYARSVGRWHVLSLPGFQRGYTRLSIDPATGGETWLYAEWVNGGPAKVSSALVVKVQAGAAFGTVEQTARQWSFAWTLEPATGLTSLYADGRGQRVFREVAGGPVTGLQDITWQFDGLNVVQDYDRPGRYFRQRTWRPVAAMGKFRFVMESETIDLLTGDGPQPLIQSRLVYYEDMGSAEPAPASKKKVTRLRAISLSSPRAGTVQF